MRKATGRGFTWMLVAAGVTAAVVSCAPDGGGLPSSASVPPATTAGEGGVQSSNDMAPVFKTRPEADQDGRIFGTTPFSVEFNMCPTFDVLDRNVKFTYDYEDDGVVDYFGHCRQNHVYETSRMEIGCTPTRICAWDRTTELACVTYQVCVSGGGDAPITPTPTPTPEVTDPPPSPTATPSPTSFPCGYTMTAC